MQIHMSFRHLKYKWLLGESQSHALVIIITFRTSSSPSQRNCAEHHTFPFPAAIHCTASCLLWAPSHGVCASLDTAQEWSCVLWGHWILHHVFVPTVLVPTCRPGFLPLLTAWCSIEYYGANVFYFPLTGRQVFRPWNAFSVNSSLLALGRLFPLLKGKNL